MSAFHGALQRIGITQRVEVFEPSGERRDCLDQRWSPLLESIGCVAVPLPNLIGDPSGAVRRLGLDGVVLSGGNNLVGLGGNEAPERDALEIALLETCLRDGVPILGVCRGMQMIAKALGGKVAPTEGHVAVRHAIAVEDPVIPDGDLEVNSFHDFTVPADGCPEGFVVAARAPDGSIEAFRHGSAPCVGVMWHPEREEPHRDRDLTILRRLFGTTA